MAASKTQRWLALWLLLSLLGAGGLGYALFGAQPTPLRTLFTPGPMTHGHHSIELACDACHTTAFGGGPVLQEACMNCHGAALKLADDSHPKSKFTDPRNADRTAKLDARECVACHVEHRPDITGEMGVTLPQDFCVTCHVDIGEERPTHAGFGFETCASAGCHNFHDNRALYEDFLLKHVHEPMLLDKPALPARDFGARWRAKMERVAATAPDHPGGSPALVRDWLETAHAQAGVQCSDCHAPKQQAWTDHPDPSACKSCHETEVDGFLAGMHGMRLAAGLSPMTPAMAQQPMQADAAHRELSCTSCHGAHRFDTREAASKACLGCHADPHSLAFEGSPHQRLWQRELDGDSPAGSGVSCASCHLPRTVDEAAGVTEVRVEHNQNANLQPNAGMIRPVCMQCHGLGFSIDALADPALIRNNFRGQPLRHIESIDMAVRNLEADRARRDMDEP